MLDAHSRATSSDVRGCSPLSTETSGQEYSQFYLRKLNWNHSVKQLKKIAFELDSFIHLPNLLNYCGVKYYAVDTFDTTKKFT